MTEHTTGEPCTRTDKTIRWVVFHAGELAGIAVPLLLAVAVAAWFGLLAVVAAVWWVVHEIRDHLRHRAIPVAADRRRLTTARDTTPPSDTTTNPETRREAHS
jgi:hypothetical protein